MKNEPIEPLEIAEPRLQSLLVGRNARGAWVVRDPLGMRGGLFSSRTEAIRFATLDHGRPRAAVMVPYLLELDVRKPAAAANDATIRAGGTLEPRQAAGQSGDSGGRTNAHV